MAKRVVVDAGPLVAILRKDDQHHEACRAVSSQIQPPLITTWLVVTEAAWLLRKVPGGVDRLLNLLESGLVNCPPIDETFVPWVREFLRRYADLEPQIADASLVFAADLLDTEAIFTLDRRDFRVFRNRHGKPFELLPESL
jgi:predicted nucleic acid-binding protein